MLGPFQIHFFFFLEIKAEYRYIESEDRGETSSKMKGVMREPFIFLHYVGLLLLPSGPQRQATGRALYCDLQHLLGVAFVPVPYDKACRAVDKEGPFESWTLAASESVAVARASSALSRFGRAFTSETRLSSYAVKRQSVHALLWRPIPPEAPRRQESESRTPKQFLVLNIDHSLFSM